MKGNHFYSVSNEEGGGMDDEVLQKLGRSREQLRYVTNDSVSIHIKRQRKWTSLAVHWLSLCVSKAGGAGSISGQRTKIPHATGCGHK